MARQRRGARFLALLCPRAIVDSFRGLKQLREAVEDDLRLFAEQSDHTEVSSPFLPPFPRPAAHPVRARRASSCPLNSRQGSQA